MHFIVLDFEWNQYPRWTRAPEVRDGVAMKNEIIQMGAVRTDEHFNPVDTFCCCVRLPDKRKLSRHVAQLIDCTQADLDKGLDFSDAYAQLNAFCAGAERIFCWGPDDEHVLCNNVDYYRLQRPAIPFYDAQRMYRRQVDGSTAQVSLQKAMEHFALVDDRRAHDALNDAGMAARVLARLDLKLALEQYNDMMIDLPADALASGHTPIELGRGAVREQARAVTFNCPTCGKQLRRNMERFGSRNSWMEAAHCREHGPFVVRFKVLSGYDGTHCVRYALYPMDEQARKRIEEVRAHKREKKRLATARRREAAHRRVRENNKRQS